MMILAATAANDAAFSIESIKEMMDGLDPAALLPEINTIVDKIALICRIAILIGPIVFLGAGLAYLLFAPKEANYYFGYRTTFGMGSVTAWRHTQKVAGLLFTAVGLVLTVIMLMICVTFNSGDAMDMVWRAVKCLIWEGALFLLANFTVNSVAAMTFDYKGKKRRKSKK